MTQLGNAVRRNTVKASKIASVGNGDAKVVEMPIVLINELNMITSHKNLTYTGTIILFNI